MSQLHAKGVISRSNELTDEQYRARCDALGARPEMAADNVSIPGSGTRGLAVALLVLGLAGLAGVVVGGVTVNLKHALAAYLVGVSTVVACSLGALFFVMIFHALNAGWSVTVRRQFENIAAMTPVAMLLLLPLVVVEILQRGVLYTWMHETDSYLVDKKSPFLNTFAFVSIYVVFGAIWSMLAFALRGLSIKHEQTLDRRLTRKARFMSGWGLLFMALSTAFFAFAFLMSPDFRFFSTMWGVYYFASCMLGCLAVVLIVTSWLRLKGKLRGVVTAEHYHDMGKLLFAFTVFWAYIAFGQYFLIWYSNIPEETAWFLYRQQGGWETLFAVLAIGHFVIPFVFLLSRTLKRSMAAVLLFSIWLLATVVLDMVFIVRPMVYTGIEAEAIPGPELWWIDGAAIVGVLGVWAGVLLLRYVPGNLIPTRDPMLHESLKHKNYV